MRVCETSLLKRFDLERVSLDEAILDELRLQARELEIDWSVIEKADATEHTNQDWKNLLHLVGLAQPRLEERLLNRSEHLLLVHPGLLARYDLMAVLEKLRDRAGHDASCPGVWVLVATDEQHEMPFLDHSAIPLISPAQRARVSEPWIDNLHRGKAAGSVV
jgi:hypothetical protein